MEAKQKPKLMAVVRKAHNKLFAPNILKDSEDSKLHVSLESPEKGKGTKNKEAPVKIFWGAN